MHKYYSLGIVTLDLEFDNLNWLVYDTIKLNDLLVTPHFFSTHKKEWLTFYNENIESISYHKAYRCYPKTKQLLQTCNIEIVHVQNTSRKDIAIIKTFWLKEFQRMIKKYLTIKQHIFKKLKYREILGRANMY